MHNWPGGEDVERTKRRSRSGLVRSPVSGYLPVLEAAHGDGEWFTRTRRVARFKEWLFGAVRRSATGQRPPHLVGNCRVWVPAPSPPALGGEARAPSREVQRVASSWAAALPSVPTMFFFSFSKTNFCELIKSPDHTARVAGDGKTREKTTLSGGSLGSCVDEERSQLRYLV